VGDTAALQAELEGLMADLKRLVADQPAATWTGGGEDGGDNPDDLFDDVPV
jgi:hypothetical protein